VRRRSERRVCAWGGVPGPSLALGVLIGESKRFVDAFGVQADRLARQYASPYSILRKRRAAEYAIAVGRPRDGIA
jgi:hypothetical protein